MLMKSEKSKYRFFAFYLVIPRVQQFCIFYIFIIIVIFIKPMVTWSLELRLTTVVISVRVISEHVNEFKPHNSIRKMVRHLWDLNAGLDPLYPDSTRLVVK